jgi:hypothetical protein
LEDIGVDKSMALNMVPKEILRESGLLLSVSEQAPVAGSPE